MPSTSASIVLALSATKESAVNVDRYLLDLPFTKKSDDDDDDEDDTNILYTIMGFQYFYQLLKIYILLYGLYGFIYCYMVSNKYFYYIAISC